MNLFRIYIVVGLIVGIPQTQAYTQTTGVELGDVIIIQEILKFNDTGLILSTHTDRELNTTDLNEMVGLIDGVIGMKIQEFRNFTIPADKAYGNALVAEIFLRAINYNVRDLTTSTSKSDTETRDNITQIRLASIDFASYFIALTVAMLISKYVKN